MVPSWGETIFFNSRMSVFLVVELTSFVCQQRQGICKFGNRKLFPQEQSHIERYCASPVLFSEQIWFQIKIQAAE